MILPAVNAVESVPNDFVKKHYLHDFTNSFAFYPSKRVWNGIILLAENDLICIVKNKANGEAGYTH